MDEGTLIGPYEVVALVGAGGMGEVYRARDTRLGRDVAVKMLADRVLDNASSVLRFQQEARLAGSLNHPNVVSVHDVGEHEGRPFIVTELLHGQSLRQLIDAGAVPPAQAAGIALQIAHGLSAAHQAGVVHRDLKPDNLFVMGDGRVKILDFGIAKLVDSRASPMSGEHAAARTAPGSVLGTPAYMSPEQVRREEATAGSDVFSFGCILYEMLAGKRAFAAGNAMELGAAILHVQPDPLPPGTPAALAEIVERCLRKDPAARFPSAVGLAAALEDAQSASRPVRGRRSRAALGSIAGLLFVALAAAAYWRWGPPARRAAEAAPPPSIAVLPFVNMTRETEQEYFAEGLSEELLNLLAKVPGLRVVGRTSSFSFKGKNEDVRTIAQKLNVRNVLEGSVRRSGGRLRVTAQLINAADGFHLWSDTYDRQVTDVFRLQDDIARAVVAALQLKLLPPEGGPRTTVPEAYKEYLLGMHFARRWYLTDLVKAAAAFDRAIALDPRFAAAWAKRAMIGWYTANLENTSSAEVISARFDAAVAQANKAMELDPSLGDAYLARGFVRGLIRHDFQGAHDDLQRAAALSPGNWEVRNTLSIAALAPLGRLDEAVAEARKATELEPLSTMAFIVLGRQNFMAGDLAAARVAFEKALELDPDTPAFSGFLCQMLLVANRPAEAAAAVEGRRFGAVNESCGAMSDHKLGKTDQAQRAIEAVIAHYPDGGAYQIVQYFAWTGQPARALEWLERAWAARDTGLILMKVDPMLQSLRGDPRFRAVQAKMNLPAD